MIKKIVLMSLIAATGLQSVDAEKIKPTQNVIVMIPDGTSLSVLSASRWLRYLS